jgi:hypothetical protein
MSNARVCVICGYPILETGAPVVDAHPDGGGMVNDHAHRECAIGYARFCRWNARHGEQRVDAAHVSPTHVDDMPAAATYQPALLEAV